MTERLSLSLSFMVHQSFFQLLALKETQLSLKITEHVVHASYRSRLQASVLFYLIS